MSLQAKLRKLEQTARATFTCGLCRGQPLATWRIDLKPDPNGPGCIAGPCLLDESYKARLTDDGQRCRRCGESVKEHLILERPTMGEL